MAKIAAISEDLKRQREYVKRLLDSDFDFGLVLADAFVKGMRDIGYKNTGTAVDELIDNSKQGEATSVHVLLGHEDSQKKPAKLAVIDDGHGMDPTMIRAAVLWGGTHRHNDRQGFGRYGYGLPSACVSIGQRYTVYSLVEGGQWHKVTIDLKAIEAYFREGNVGHIIVPEAEPSELPSWISEYVVKHFDTLSHGTVVIVEDIDRLTYRTTQNLREFFLQHFGVTYRNVIREMRLFVDGKKVDAIDPLFTTPGARFYDIDDDRAEALPPMNIEIKDRNTKEPAGVIKVRFSYMPPTFFRAPEDKLKGRGGKLNPRFTIRKDNNGIIVLRAGRQIDVARSQCPWTTFQNNDRYIGVEVDFTPTLDEEFSITTSKQQVVLSQRIWDILEENGVYDAISQMRRRFAKDSKTIEVGRDSEERERASEAAMKAAQKYVNRNQTEESAEEVQEGEENLEREAKRLADESGLPPDVVKEGLKKKVSGRKFRVDFVDHPGAPFYYLERIGGQKVLFINKAHEFYTEFYAAPDSTPTMRFRLEVLLFVFGDCELRATAQDFRRFYQVERAEWTKYLSIALQELSDWDTKDDDAQANAEMVDAADNQAARQTATG